jgi:Tripartite ATP-independent periplasmic transporters, DctQ component
MDHHGPGAGVDGSRLRGRLISLHGAALAWYDELASIGLVWLTFYGSALAALKGAHIGVAGLVNIMLRNVRVAVALTGSPVTDIVCHSLVIRSFGIKARGALTSRAYLFTSLGFPPAHHRNSVGLP